jgi:drug/metabolite transporter (DMT)-like permease
MPAHAARAATPEPPAPLAARLRLVAAAALFSTGGAAIKATALTGWQVASLRSGVAALFILLALPGARRRWSRPAVAVGAAYAATMILFVLANKLTTAANAIYLQATSPLYLLVLGPLVLGEPIRRRDLAFMAALAVGLGLFFVGLDAPSATAPRPLAGNLAAVGAGFFWALTVTGLRGLGRTKGRAEPIPPPPAGCGDAGDAAAVTARVLATAATGTAGAPASASRPFAPAVADPARRADDAGQQAVFLGNLFAFLGCLPLALPVAVAAPADWAIIGYLGTFQIGLAYVLLTAGLREVTAFEASLLLLVEPVLNPVWAWLLHGERPGPWSLAGAATILAATAIKTALDLRRAGRAA